jgi:transcriptional regulator with XRE-family HTH domain
MHIVGKIKLLRKAKLLTQEQLQEISGVSKRTIRRLEATGKAESATLVSILNASGTTLEELERITKS